MSETCISVVWLWQSHLEINYLLCAVFTLKSSDLKGVNRVFSKFGYKRQTAFLVFQLHKMPKLVCTYDAFSSKNKQSLLKGKSGVYGWYCIVDNKNYIGSGKDLYERAFEHLNNPKGSNRNLQQAMNLHGLKNFVFIVFDYSNSSLIVTAKELELIEDAYLGHFHKSVKYNILDKAYSSIGFTHSSETRKIISELRKGKALSEKTKLKLSLLFSGQNNPFFVQKYSDEFKQKLSIQHSAHKNPMFNKPKSAEFLAQQVKDKTGANNPMSKVVVLKDVTTGQTIGFNSIKACSDALKTQRSYISKLCNTQILYKNKYLIYTIE
jgi:group I intron endonuclease